MKNKDTLDSWRAYVAIAHSGSVKQASIELNQDMSCVSRLLVSLEDSLGLSLINRATRPLSLTPHGRALIEHADNFLKHHEQLIQMARMMTGTPQKYRLCFPLNVGRDTLIDQLLDYRQVDPTLEFELMSECDHEDVLNGRVDIAMLPYRPPAKGLLLWSTGDGYNFPLATPEYLKTHGEPVKPEDLANHTLILRTGRNYPPSYFVCRRSEKKPLVWKEIGFSGDALSCKAAVLADVGIAMDLSFDLCKEEILRGELIPVLHGWHRTPWQMTVIVNKKLEDNVLLMQFAHWFVQRELVDNKARWKPMFRRLGGEPNNP